MSVFSNSLSSLELLAAYVRNPSLKLRNQLVEINTGLVRQVAHRYAGQCGEPYEDLEQIGYLGLIRAIERFAPQHGYAFSSFAIPYIRGEILHYLRDKGTVMRIPRRWQELYTKGKKLRKQLAVSLGRQPKEKEIAQALEITAQEWYECLTAQTNRLMISLDGKLGQSADGQVLLAETLADPKITTQQKQAEERLQLQKALSQLEKKTQIAIEYVFLREIPRKEAAQKIGISPMTVTRHLKKGIEQLIILMEPQVA